MAQVVNGSQVKLNDGKVIQAQQGGWYDGQQFWGGTLSQPGQINSMSNQQGAGQAVSKEVIAQTNPANVAYIDAQRKQAGLSPSPSGAVSTLPSSPASAGGSGVGYTAPVETINLPKLYEGMYASSGIRDIEMQLSEKTNQYNNAVAKIKDNPFLSEATMTGRLKKLEEKFNADSLNIKNDIAVKKADIETRLNLETKQFDINSQVARDELAKFNSLLQSGALAGASGEDVANITRSTGISSSMVMSAINAQKAKDVQSQVITSTADSGEVTATVLNTQTGEIISSQSLGFIGNKQTGGAGGTTATKSDQSNKPLFAQALQASANSYGHVGPTTWVQAMNDWVARGGAPATFVESFSNFTDPNRGDFEKAYGFSLKQRGITPKTGTSDEYE